MYAIIKAGGRQYKVEPGTVFEMNRLAIDEGETLMLDDSVLMVSKDDELTVGTPLVEGAKVELEVNEHFRGKKLIVFKMKRRKSYRRKNGHRQELTRVTVKDITLA
ncbi:MAG: 50S ribosomal protein L21 [Lentisphaeria bacterium]|nr:50S ribosomal protein L21 [Lentisphaeria bacterium]